MDYFEEFAELIETDDELEFEDIFAALKGSRSEDIGEIVENYMNEIQESVPDAENEFYMLIENIKTGMLFLCENLEDKKTLRQFAEEVYKFRQWYTSDCCAIINNKKTTVLDAVTSFRAAAITGEEISCSFAGCLSYELSDFEMSIGSFSEIDTCEDDDTQDFPTGNTEIHTIH